MDAHGDVFVSVIVGGAGFNTFCKTRKQNSTSALCKMVLNCKCFEHDSFYHIYMLSLKRKGFT